MILPWLTLLGTVLAWSIVWLWKDSPAVPVYQTRNAYRGLIAGLILAIVLAVWWGQAKWMELRVLIESCR